MTEINPENAIKTALENGAGEILINNIDFDGSLLGYDLKIIKSLTKKFNCQFLALGELVAGVTFQSFNETEISAACTQNIFTLLMRA